MFAVSKLGHGSTVTTVTKGEGLASPGFFVAFGMAAEGASRRKFTEFVTDHLFGYENRNVLATVVDGDGVTDHLGQDG